MLPGRVPSVPAAGQRVTSLSRIEHPLISPSCVLLPPSFFALLYTAFLTVLCYLCFCLDPLPLRLLACCFFACCCAAWWMQGEGDALSRSTEHVKTHLLSREEFEQRKNGGSASPKTGTTPPAPVGATSFNGPARRGFDTGDGSSQPQPRLGSSLNDRDRSGSFGDRGRSGSFSDRDRSGSFNDRDRSGSFSRRQGGGGGKNSRGSPSMGRSGLASRPKFFPTPDGKAGRGSSYKQKYGDNPVDEQGVGWVIGTQRHPPRPLGSSLGTSPGSVDSSTGTPQVGYGQRAVGPKGKREKSEVWRMGGGGREKGNGEGLGGAGEKE